MLLSDRDILSAMENGSIGVDPFNIKSLQPASIDAHLHPTVLRFRRREIDLRSVPEGHTFEHEIPEDGFPLFPGECILGSTVEVIRLGPDIASRTEGVSSLGRLFLSVHETAGFIDPGFEGQVTLEIKNNSQNDIILYAGMRIAQVCFFRTSSPCLTPYGVKGNYMGQRGPRESRYKLTSLL